MPAVVVYALALARLIPWPQASSLLGVSLGLLGAFIIFFEMAMAPAKWFRGYRTFRIFGATKAWLRLHVWLGLLVLPIIVIHTGFAFGGLLSTVTLILFLLTIASGVWGLLLQQVIPKKILDDIPVETVASQVDFAVQKHRDEARAMADELTGGTATIVQEFRTTLLDPYLQQGAKSKTLLASATESTRLFARLRKTLPTDVTATVNKLESLADLRRQWDRQRRLNWWLHSWLVIHTPLSVAMSGLMVLHAILAMKWW